jgi:uncharacterized paraquat-inducible protein A
MMSVYDSLVPVVQVQQQIRPEKLVSSHHIIFCKRCNHITEVFQKVLPNEATCSNCKTSAKLRFKRHWNGDYSRLSTLTITSIRSRAGAAFLKIVADAELRAQAGDA